MTRELLARFIVGEFDDDAVHVETETLDVGEDRRLANLEYCPSTPSTTVFATAVRTWRAAVDGTVAPAAWHVRRRRGAVFIRVRLNPGEIAVVERDFASGDGDLH